MSPIKPRFVSVNSHLWVESNDDLDLNIGLIPLVPHIATPKKLQFLRYAFPFHKALRYLPDNVPYLTSLYNCTLDGRLQTFNGKRSTTAGEVVHIFELLLLMTGVCFASRKQL